MEREKLKQIIAQVLSVDAGEIENETKFADDLGADSLDLYQIALEVEKEFNIIVDERAMGINTLEQAMKLVLIEN